MAARKTAPKSETVVEHIEDICRACWPHGWPHQHTSASCEHGTYAREGAETPADTGEQSSPEEKTPADDSKTPEDTAPAGENTGA